MYCIIIRLSYFIIDENRKIIIIVLISFILPNMIYYNR